MFFLDFILATKCFSEYILSLTYKTRLYSFLKIQDFNTQSNIMVNLKVWANTYRMFQGKNFPNNSLLQSFYLLIHNKNVKELLNLKEWHQVSVHFEIA